MDRSENKILIISYHFPPSRAMGGKRVAAFAKYLQELGWQTYVVTINDGEVEEKDPESFDDQHTVQIHTAGKLPTLRDVILWLKSALRKEKSTEHAVESPIAEVHGDAGQKPGFKQQVKHFIASLLFLPDEHKGWIIPAAWRSASLIKRWKIGCILTSCPPYSAHMVGLLLKLRFPKIRWVADFRDPWMVPLEKEIYPTTRFSNWIEYGLEKRVVTKSSLVLTTTARLAEKLSQHYHGVDPNKFTVIANGYEPADLPTAKEKYPVFTISYTGSLYFGRTPEPLFQAVAALIGENMFSPDDIRIQLVGHCREINGEPAGRVAGRYNLADVVKIVDSVPYRESLEIIQRSHIALLLAPGQPYQIPGKTYEYIGLGTPILALTEEGATAEVIRSIADGKAVASGNVEEIQEFVLHIYKTRDNSSPSPNEKVPGFTRRETVDKLAQLIDTPA